MTHYHLATGGNEAYRLKPMLTIVQVAEWLGVSVSTVRRRCREGKLCFVKVNRAVRFTVQAVLKYIDQYCIPPER